MKEIYKFLIQLIVIIEIFIVLFIFLSGLKSPEYAKINIFIIIPLIFLIGILPFEGLEYPKKYLASKCIDPLEQDIELDKVIDENSNKFILPTIHKTISNLYYVNDNNTFNPVNYHGILILGYIINIYLLKYKWHFLN